MTKSIFRRHVVMSSLLTVVAIAIIIVFCVLMFDKYSYLNEENTSLEMGTVADVYHQTRGNSVVIEMTDGERFQLVYPNFSRELYTTIGYDFDELCELLEGKKIEYRRMNRLPWMVEIYVDDVVIDNNELTDKQITATRIGIVIVGGILLAFTIAGEVTYLKSKHRIYKKAEKKRRRRMKNEQAY